MLRFKRAQKGVTLLEVLLASFSGSLLIVALLQLILMQYRLSLPLRQQWLIQQNVDNILLILKEEIARSGFNYIYPNTNVNHLFIDLITPSIATFSDSDDVVTHELDKVGGVYRITHQGENTLRHIVYQYQKSGSLGRLIVCEKHSNNALSFANASSSSVGSLCYSAFDDNLLSVDTFSVSLIAKTLFEVRLKVSFIQYPHLNVESKIYVSSRN